MIICVPYNKIERWFFYDFDPLCFPLSSLLLRCRFEQTLDLRVEIFGNNESLLTSIRSDEARHRVVGQMHSIFSFIDQDFYYWSYNKHKRKQQQVDFGYQI